MVSKEAYMQKMQAKTQELDAQIKLWQANAKVAKADARINAENQLEALQRQRDEIAQQLGDLSDVSEEKLQELKEKAEKTWQTVQESVTEKTAEIEIPAGRSTFGKLSMGLIGTLIILMALRWAQENI